MTFANADAFLLLLLLIPLAVVKIIGDGMARRRVSRIAGARLLPHLRRGGWRGRELLVFLFEVLAIAFFIAALARPQWGYTEKQIQGEGRSIIVALDTSRSMLATDLKPNRLTRAKLAAVDLVASLPGDRIGLIAFAGRAFLQAPLTTDHEALVEALQQFDTELIPRGGSNPSEAIQLAVEVFDKAGTASHALVMFSDGDETEGSAVEAARKAKDRGVMIVTVGVGTREGSLLPDANPQRQAAGILKDSSGRPVRSKLEDRVLESMARETGGLYLNLSSGSELRERVQVILNKLDKSRTAAQKEKRQPIERYGWALVPAMVCLVLAFGLRLGRRLRAPAPAWNAAALASSTLLVCLLGTPSAAGGVLVRGAGYEPSPWQLYGAARYEAAAETFARELEANPSRVRGTQLEFGRGAAAFQQKDHDSAIEAFGRALTSPNPGLQAESAYNLGNALADKAKNLPKAKGRVSAMIDLITQAIGHYDEALKIQPGHANARDNREALAKYLEQLKKYRQELRDKAKQKKKDKGDKSQEQEGQQGQDQEQGQQGENQPGGQGKGNQGGEEGDEEEEEEEGGDDPGDAESAGKDGEAQGKSEEGDQPGEGKGKQDDQKSAAPGGQEKERSGEQKDEGQVQAKGGGEGGQGDQQKKKPSERIGTTADAKRNKSTGFSRSEARSLLRALSDEDYVRPLTERAQPEGSYKNW